MKSLVSFLGKLLNGSLPTEESKTQKPPAREIFEAEMRAVEERWRTVAEEAESQLKAGDTELALRKYEEAFEICLTRENRMREAGSPRQMNKLYSLVLGKAKALTALGRSKEALREYFLLFDLNASTDIERSRFLYEGRGKSLTKREFEADIRDAYKFAVPSGIANLISEIKEDEGLSVENLRAAFDDAIARYHSALSLEADPERVWKSYLKQK